MKKNNRGLTLVELIISIAISTIVVGAIASLMISGSQNYSSSKSETSLQMTAQETMSRISDLVVDANRNITYRVKEADGGSYVNVIKDSVYDTLAAAAVTPTSDSGVEKELIVYSRDKIYLLNWRTSTDEIRYKEITVADGVYDPDPMVDSSDVNSWDLLADHVVSFAVDLTDLDIHTLSVKCGFQYQERTYLANNNIALRNAITTNVATAMVYKSDSTSGDTSEMIINGINFNPSGRVIQENGVLKIKQGETATAFADLSQAAENSAILWTITGQTSSDTSINVKTGLLTIGMTEPVDSLITVTAILNLNRSVNKSVVLKVTEAAAPTLTIVGAQSLNRGESASFTCTAEMADHTVVSGHTVNWSFAEDSPAHTADTKIAGGVLTVALGETATTLKIKATMPDYPNTSPAYATVVINKPSFTASPTTGTYDHGADVKFSVNWSNVIADNSNAKLLTATAVDQNNKTVTLSSNEGVGPFSFTMPGSGVSSVTVTLKPVYYTDVEAKTVTFNASQVGVTVTAPNGTESSAIYKAGSTYHFTAAATGINSPAFSWSAVRSDTGATFTSVSSNSYITIPSNMATGSSVTVTATLNGYTDASGNRVQGSVKIPITKIACEYLDYLVNDFDKLDNSYNENILIRKTGSPDFYAFVPNLASYDDYNVHITIVTKDNNSVINNGAQYIKCTFDYSYNDYDNDIDTNLYTAVFELTPVDNKLNFFKNVKYIILNVDSKDDSEHKLLKKYVPLVANCQIEGGPSYYVKDTPITAAETYERKYYKYSDYYTIEYNRNENNSMSCYRYRYYLYSDNNKYDIIDANFYDINYHYLGCSEQTKITNSSW